MKYKLLRISTQSYANPELLQLRFIFQKNDGSGLEMQRHTYIPTNSNGKLIAQRLRELAFELENTDELT